MTLPGADIHDVAEGVGLAYQARALRRRYRLVMGRALRGGLLLAVPGDRLVRHVIVG